MGRTALSTIARAAGGVRLWRIIRPETACTTMATVTEGDILEADLTGKQYRIAAIEDGEVHVPGLLPLPKEEVERDIEKGLLIPVN